jgi:glucose/arabinose dehydrogenase
MKTPWEFLNEDAVPGMFARSYRRRNLIVLVIPILLLVSRANLPAATVQVLVGNGGTIFSPSSVSVQAGDTAEWIWKSSNHSTTSGTPGAPNGFWDSSVQNSGFTFFHKFPLSGSFSYYCTPHGACCGMVGSVNVAAATASPTPIPKGPVRAQVLTVASGLTAPLGLVPPGDGSGRLFIYQQTGQVLILKNATVVATPFLNVASRLVSLSPGYDERGLLGFAFHPDFNNASAPGFHKVYTYTSEPVSGAADFTVPKSTAFDHQNVIAEWQVSSANPDAIDPATRREVMRIDQPQSNHNGGQLAFRPADRYLYISLGDGGAGNDVGDGHSASGNAQDFSTVLGKILRIDPLDPALTTGSADFISANGKYRIPQSNPFVALVGPQVVVAEIYALGLRNPYRFSFDATSDQFVIGDVGQNNIEEVDLGASGKNYGWNKREGSYVFDPNSGAIGPDLTPDTSLTEPIAQYSHTDGSAVIGGFIYRGALLPALSGKYIFGDLASGSGGRLFYADLTNGVIQELRLGLPEAPLGYFIKGFGQDTNGEVYVLVDSSEGPSGAGAKVLKIATIQPMAAVSEKIHGATARDIDLLTLNLAIECRSGGSNNSHQIILTFPGSVTFAGATVTPGNGGTANLDGPPTTSPDGAQVTVNLKDVTNAQKITITLLGVNDGTNTDDVSVQMGVLLGDVNATGGVDGNDVSAVQAHTRQSASASNFRFDVNGTGGIDGNDVSLTQSKTRTSLP